MTFIPQKEIYESLIEKKSFELQNLKNQYDSSSIDLNGVQSSFLSEKSIYEGGETQIYEEVEEGFQDEQNYKFTQEKMLQIMKEKIKECGFRQILEIKKQEIDKITSQSEFQNQNDSENIQQRIDKFKNKNIKAIQLDIANNKTLKLTEADSQNFYLKTEFEKTQDFIQGNFSNPNGSKNQISCRFHSIKNLNFAIIYEIEELINSNDSGDKKYLLWAEIHAYNSRTQDFEKAERMFLDVISKIDGSFIENELNRIKVLNEQIYVIKKFQNDQNKDDRGIEILQFDIKVETEKLEIVQSKSQETRRIIFPNNSNLTLEDVDISFTINTKNHEFQTLDQQFIHIQHYQYVLQRIQMIYSLQKLDEPIIFLDKGQMYKNSVSFDIELDEESTAFVFLSNYGATNYSIVYNNHLSETNQKNYLPEFKQSSNELAYLTRLYTMQLDPLSIEIVLSKEQKFKQYYFINYSGQLQFIYPLHQAEDKQKVVDQILDKHQIDGEKKVIISSIDDSINYYNYNDYEGNEIFPFLNEKGIKNFNKNENFQLIIYQNIIQYIQKSGDVQFFVYDNESNDLLNQERVQDLYQYQSSRLLFKELMKEFDFKDDHEIYQDNYEDFTTSIINQYSKNFYLNKEKALLFSSHNCVYVQQQKFKFFQNHLLIDFSNNRSGLFSQDIVLFNLYSDFGQKKQVKLVKYFLQDRYVVFCFLYRQKNVGFYFFRILDLNQLFEIKENNKFILQEENKIFILNDINAINIEFFNFSTITKYSLDSKKNHYTDNFVLFEQIDDLQCPHQYLFFILHSKFTQDKFDHYFCLMNVETLYQDMINTDQKQLTFSSYIQTQRIDFYQKQDEPLDFKNCTPENSGLRMDVISKGRRSQNIFARSSNWSQNQDNFIAKFVSGANIKSGGVEYIEFKEYAVSFKKQWNKLGLLDTFSLRPTQIKNLVFQQNFLNQIRSSSDNTNPIENNKIVPSIDNQGNILGMNALICQKQFLRGHHLVTEDYDLIESTHGDRQDVLKILKNNLGKSIFIQTGGPKFSGCLEDGTTINELSYNILKANKYVSSFIYDIISLDQKKVEIQYNDQQILSDQKLDESDMINFIQNEIVEINVKCNNKAFLVSVNLKDKIIDNPNYDNNYLLGILYNYQKYAMTMKLSLGYDYLIDEYVRQDSSIFQHQFKYNGKSSLPRIIQDFSIQHIDQLLNIVKNQDNDYSFLKNSVLYLAQNKNQKNSLDRFIENMDISHCNEFIWDILNQKSIIDLLYKNNKEKELKYLLKKLIESSDIKSSSKLITKSILTFIQKQEKIHEFLDIDQEEENIIYQDKNQQESIAFQCNLEQLIKPKGFNDLGQDKIIVKEVKQFENQNSSYEEVTQLIGRLKLENNDKEEVQVEYSLIDFSDICKQIDILREKNQLSDISENKNVLKLLQESKFSHLLIAELINFYNEDPVMFQQSTVQTLIDYQFESIVKIKIEQQIILYLLGFVLPFLYNNISNNIYDLEIEDGTQVSTAANHSQAYEIFKIFNNILAIITLLIFSFYEYIDLKCSGAQEYFSSVKNVFDSSQLLLYLVHLLFRKFFDKHKNFGTTQVLDNFIQIILLIGAFSRLLELIRYKKEYCIFVNIFERAFVELTPFIISFFVFVLIFAIINIFMQAGLEMEEDEYTGLPFFVETFLQVFRTSLGDVKLIKYQSWGDPEKVKNGSWDEPNLFSFYFSVIIIWTTWFFNLLIIQIILLNLVIAQVSLSYDQVMTVAEESYFQEKAKLNHKILQILHYFGDKKEFIALIIQKPIRQFDEGDSFSTMTLRMTNAFQKQIDQLKNYLDKTSYVKYNEQNQNIENQIEGLRHNIDTKINGLRNEMKTNFNKILEAIQNR